MRRRDVVLILLGAAAVWPLGARSQPRERVKRVGVLMAFAPDDPEARLRVKAFESALQELGWARGRNLQLEYRWTAGDADRLRREAADLAAQAPDLILANSTPVLAAVLKESRTLPIVFVQVMDPVGNGFVPNLARPGGYLTGFTNFEFTIGTKWLEALTQIASWVKRVALLFNPESAPFARMLWQPVEAAAPSFGVEPIQMPARAASEIERAVESFARQANGGLMVMPDVSTVQHRDLIIALAARHHLPAVYPFRFFAASGGLISYGSDTADVFRRAASYVDRILKGANPGELPVQAPAKYELVINLKTAKTMGLTVPPYLLARADEVIE